MILPLVLILAQTLLASPSPAPTPTTYGSYGSLPLIITVHANAVCSTLRQTVMPVGYIAKTNDAAFTDVKNRTLKVAMSRISDTKDFEMLAHHDQSDVSAVVGNSELALKLIDDSQKRYPANKNPEIEAMRQELVRIIDLQRQYNSLIDSISGAYLDSLSNDKLYGGMYGQSTANVQMRNLDAQRQFINRNRALLGLQPFDEEPIANTDASSQQSQIIHNSGDPLIEPKAGASPGTQSPPAQISSDLQDAEGRLQTTAIAALRLCNAQATPSPKP